MSTPRGRSGYSSCVRAPAGGIRLPIASENKHLERGARVKGSEAGEAGA
jgi:hypothetical protein